MSEGKQPSQLSGIILLLLSVIGIIVGTWMMTFKAHKYYYPGVPGVVIRTSQSTFTAARSGRYEISHSADLGSLTFEVVSEETGVPIPVAEFGLLSHTVHTLGWHGYALHIATPGVYRLAVQPWHNGHEVHLKYMNTDAVGGWALGGLLLAGLCGAYAVMWLIVLIGRYKKRRIQPA